ncbi:MAG: GNAT family N-acetyltransferase [Acidobacteria bacterium]|nr:GNAT family N-acetyltransferase [Acidobacteriota bacterium]
MSPVRRGVKSDATAIAQRVADQLSRDASVEPLVSKHFSRHDFEQALAHSASPVWVEDSSGLLRGHLYGATFDDPLNGRQTWTGPDGYSYEFENVLDNLCDWAYREWRESGSAAHLVWALAGNGTQDWIERGYHVVSVRGSLALGETFDFTWPAGHHVRRGDGADLDIALAFDALIDLAQGIQLDSLTDDQRESNEADLVDLLGDPDCHYHLVEVDGVAAAQCVTFPLPPLRGSHDDTVYLGSLAVEPRWRRRGLATVLVHAVLNHAIEDGFRFAEVRWHIDNEEATSLWSSLGFRPTYVQLRRSLRT